MVQFQADALDLVFRALSDPTRRGMLGSLGSGERSVSELAEPLNMTITAVSKHVAVLERAGLVHRSKRGRTHFVRLDPRPLGHAHEWLGKQKALWSAQFDNLDAYLARKKGTDTRDG
jgi:DNA-binding transcriptional ArsR family regulator